MNLSNLSLCYEGIQRTYRNAVVRYIRKMANERHPEGFQQVLKATFAKEWEKMNESAQERRRTGEIAAEILDDFDLLGVNHFFNLFDQRYDDLCPAASETKDEQLKKEKQALVQWMRTVKNLRDPLSHPSEEDFSFEEAFDLLYCAKRVLSRLGLEDEANEVRSLMDNLSGRPLSIRKGVEPLEDHLPPRESIVIDFVGRTPELAALWEWFLDPVSRRWALAGEGGKGKTALAYKFALEVKFEAPAPFQVILWLSAKKRRFQEGSVVPVGQPDFSGFDDALSRILVHYGWFEEASYPTERKRTQVMDLLNAFPALLIVDDVDSLEEDEERAIEFFTFQAPQTKSKVLLTSRRVVFGMGGTTTHVEGLSEQDARTFIASRCNLMELDRSSFSEATTREILNVTERSPLYMEDLLRLFAVMKPEDAVRSWRSKGGDEARVYALGRELDLLSDAARLALVAACMPPGPISFPELEAVTGLSDERLASALRELQRLFLVPKPRLIEGEQRFEVNLNTRALLAKMLGGSDLYRRTQRAYHAVSGRLPREEGRADIAAIIRQAVLLVRNHQQQDAEQLLQKALEKYLNDRDLTGFLGWVYKAWDPPRLTDAREGFHRAWQLKCANAEMYRHWSQMELNEREWTRAAVAAEKGIKLLPHAPAVLYFQAGYARSRLARELAAGLHRERAQEELSKSQELLRKALRSPEALEPGERNLNADTYRALVLNCEMLNDLRGLQAFFEQWLAEHPDDPNAESEWKRLSARFTLQQRLSAQTVAG
jgi:hypothetical protein